MSVNQKKQKVSDSSNTPMSVNDETTRREISSKNTELVHREKILNTPFECIGNEEQGYCISFGKYKLTHVKPTVDEAIDDLEKDHWNITLNLLAIFTEFAKMDTINQIEKSKGN